MCKTNTKGAAEMSLWDTANEIEELSHKLAYARDLVELVAEVADSRYSGALWGIHGMIDDLQSKTYLQADKVMDLHREESKPKKTKK
jgi:hypothetical protein